jgi:putative ABC transport system permease protein
MKAVGAQNMQVFMQFLVEAGLLGLVGGIVGAIGGTLIGFLGTMALNSWLGATTSVEINVLLIMFTLTGSFLIGAVSGIVPAMNAARQNPVEALRG